MISDNIPKTENRYEIVLAAETEEEAEAVFHENYDGEVYGTHKYGVDTVGVFFATDEPIDVAESKMILPVEEIESDR